MQHDTDSLQVPSSRRDSWPRGGFFGRLSSPHHAGRVAVALLAVALLVLGGVSCRGRKAEEVSQAHEEAQHVSPAEQAVRQKLQELGDRQKLRDFVAERMLASDIVAFRAMMATLDGPYTRIQREGIRDGLLAVRHISTGFLIDHLAHHPRMPSGQIGALVLGRMATDALERGSEPDVRIVPALVAAASDCLREGTPSSLFAVHALASISARRPIRSIGLLTGQVLMKAGQEGAQADARAVREAARMVMVGGDELAATLLWDAMQEAPEGSPLRRGLEDVYLSWGEDAWLEALND